MQERHIDRKLYFDEQGRTTKQHVIPYISKFFNITSDTRVLEIGCGEGGNITPFLDLGCTVRGVDLNAQQIENAKTYFADHPNLHKLTLIAEDIYLIPEADIQTYDIIIMRDVIEHIHDQRKFMGFVKRFMTDKGLLFIGFPPWQMPFGGHQQICHNRKLAKLPWFHLLPVPLYRAVLRAGGENENTIETLLEVKETGISIERLRRIALQEKWSILDETLYLINPNYEVKFGLKTRKQFGLIAALPWFRNFMTTCGYYIFQVNKN